MIRPLLLLLVVMLWTPVIRAYDTVVIDAGHGGEDPGSNWYGIQEKTLTLDLAKRLQKVLLSKGLEVVLTRSDDSTVALGDRGTVANKHPNAIFVSLHFNAIIRKDITGV